MMSCEKAPKWEIGQREKVNLGLGKERKGQTALDSLRSDLLASLSALRSLPTPTMPKFGSQFTGQWNIRNPTRRYDVYLSTQMTNQSTHSIYESLDKIIQSRRQQFLYECQHNYPIRAPKVSICLSTQLSNQRKHSFY